MEIVVKGWMVFLVLNWVLELKIMYMLGGYDVVIKVEVKFIGVLFFRVWG